MKKLIFPILLLGSIMSFAQHKNDNKSDPPSYVQRSFQRDNPNHNASWSKTNNEWHATFKDDNNRDVDAYYDHNGRKMETHTRWERNQVPHDLDDKINKTYHTKDYNAVRIERANNQPLFQISLNLGGGKNRTVYMDEKGKQKQYSGHH